MQLTDKVIVLSGAAQGIGQATAVDLAKQGAKLVLADINPCDKTCEMVAAAGGDCIEGIVDVTKFADCENLVNQGVEKFGQIDGLINLAALYATLTLAPFEMIPEKEFEACLKVNVMGTWNMSRAVSPIMKKAGSGSIINIASNSAIFGFPMASQYVASKGAVIAMGRSMARELGPDNIRVNTVAPTAVATESTKQLTGTQYEAIMGQTAAMQSIQRNPTPADITGAFIYLLSDASAIVTGQTLAVDCGLTSN